MKNKTLRCFLIALLPGMLMVSCSCTGSKDNLSEIGVAAGSRDKKPWELHGGLSTGGHFLVYEDGTPFFYLGDTNWEFLVRARREDARELIENRAQKGFTVMQTVITGIYLNQGELESGNKILKANVYGDHPFAGDDVTRPLVTPGHDPEEPEQYDYWDHVDYIIETAAEHGIYIGLIPCWHVLYDEPKIVNRENARAYGNWLGDRFRDTPNIIWICGGDTRGNTGDGVEMFDELAAGIRESDGGRHLMTFHPRGGSSSSDWFHDKDWLDFNMIQSGHSRRDNPNYERITRDYNRIPMKPCMDGEPRYEDHSVNWNPANGWFNDFDVRQAAYWSLFAGSHGHTYGVRGVWQMYEPGREKRGPLNYYWYEAMDLPGGADMQHVRALMLSRPYLNRVPDQSLVAETYDMGDHIRATRGDGYAFVYVPTGRSFQVRPDKINAPDSIYAWWFSPRDGLCYNSLAETIRERPFDTIRQPFGAVIEFEPPGEPSRGNDWVLVLDDASKGFPVPGTLLTGNE